MSNGAGVNLLVNYGQVNKAVSSAITVTQPFNNLGVFNATASGVTFTNLQNYSASTASLNNGTWILSGGATISVSSAFITTLGVGTSLTLDGAGSAFNPAASLSINRGTLTLANGRAFTFTPAGSVFHNYGTFIKSGAGSITVPATVLFNNVGEIRVSGGSLAIGGQVSAGSLTTSGDGVYVPGQNHSFASVTNSGSINLGLTLLTAGSYTQTSGATLGSSVADALSFGSVRATGSCTLDGTLTVTALNGFDPSNGNGDFAASLVTAPRRVGTFSSLDAPALGFGAYAVVARVDRVILTINYADANGDGGVDGADIAHFFRFWESGSIFADVNGDGGVDGDDIAVFFRQWEQGGPG